MLSVLSVDSKRKSGSRQHPSCFETHGRRFENKKIAVAQKSFAPEFSISIYSLPFASGLLKQIMEGITFQSIQPDWKGMKTKGKRHQSGGPFHIGRRTRREEHDSFQ